MQRRQKQQTRPTYWNVHVLLIMNWGSVKSSTCCLLTVFGERVMMPFSQQINTAVKTSISKQWLKTRDYTNISACVTLSFGWPNVEFCCEKHPLQQQNALAREGLDRLAQNSTAAHYCPGQSHSLHTSNWIDDTSFAASVDWCLDRKSQALGSSPIHTFCEQLINIYAQFVVRIRHIPACIV